MAAVSESSKIFNAGQSINRASIAAIASDKLKPDLYKALYELLMAEISSVENPRRFKPSPLMPNGLAVLPAAVTNAGKSCNKMVPIAVMLCAPMWTN